MPKAKAKDKWKLALADRTTYREYEHGELVLGLRKATEIDDLDTFTTMESFDGSSGGASGAAALKRLGKGCAMEFLSSIKWAPESRRRICYRLGQ